MKRVDISYNPCVFIVHVASVLLSFVTNKLDQCHFFFLAFFDSYHYNYEQCLWHYRQRVGFYETQSSVMLVLRLQR